MLAVAEVAASVVAAADFTGVGSVVAACMPDVSTVAVIVVACVRHIPSPVAQGVPDIRSRVVPVVRATQLQAGGIIADMDTVRRRWEPQRLVPRLMALTTTATMRTAIGSVPISINIDMRPANADGGWTGPYCRPFLGYIPLSVVQATSLTDPPMS